MPTPNKGLPLTEPGQHWARCPVTGRNAPTQHQLNAKILVRLDPKSLQPLYAASLRAVYPNLSLVGSKTPVLSRLDGGGALGCVTSNRYQTPLSREPRQGSFETRRLSTCQYRVPSEKLLRRVGFLPSIPLAPNRKGGFREGKSQGTREHRCDSVLTCTGTGVWQSARRPGLAYHMSQ